MLTPSEVLNYVKLQLGIPFAPSEYTDNQMLEYIRKVPLRTFSRLVPHENKMVIDLSDPNIQTSVPNEYLIIDPDGVSIVDVKRVYPDHTGIITSGHPIMGLFGGTMEDVEQYVYQAEQANTVHKYSMFNENYEFIAPNILRITPKPQPKPRLIEYERYHTPDFRTIRPEYEETFLRLAYCDVAIWIARTRSVFRSLSTPFGDIELNFEDLKSDAQTEKDKIIDDLSTVNPSIIVDTG